jgi:hypothetical protein
MARAPETEHILLNQIAIMRMLDAIATNLGVSNFEPATIAVLRHRMSQTTKLYKSDPIEIT